jgi:iron complex transport system substrate-binding protein
LKSKIILIAVIVLVALASLAGRSFLARRQSETSLPATEAARGLAPPQRIVSLSPSTTETLFALGLGDRVVGVSRYCLYPPEAQTRTIIGGYVDPSYEAILALKPDLVVVRDDDPQYAAGFRELGLRTLAVKHNDVEGILASFSEIGRECGAEKAAEQITADIRQRIKRLEEKTTGLARPRVMIVAERALGEGKIADAYVTGGDSFLNSMIEMAGGRNACPTRNVPFPVVSAEGIIQMDPEVIVDLIAKHQQEGYTKESLMADWQQLADVPAVRDGRVYLLDDDFAFIPGPRFVRLAEKLARLIHPELTW